MTLAAKPLVGKMLIRAADGSKNKIQARHLNMCTKEVYALFTDANPNIKIGKSKFAELRPKHVLLSSQLPHNVCLCKYHENFIMAVNSLHKVINIFPQYDHHLPEKFICKSATEECWFNECLTCKDEKVLMMKRCS